MKKLLISGDFSVKEAMKQMNTAGEKVLFIVDENKRLTGSLSDGDIRRWILKEGGLHEKVDSVCNKNPFFVEEPYETERVKRLMLDKVIEWIPVVNSSRQVTDVLLWKNIFGDVINPARTILNIPVVIMAGGKGTRLDPFTKILPKPLIPIGEKAIIDLIMEKFARYGINTFYISVNHKAKMIKSYFEEINTKYSIRYIEEEDPLGTAGSLRFMRDKIRGSLMVSNCDIIIDCDYSEIAEFHDKNGYDITIVGSFRHFAIPYGICEIGKEGALVDIKEKPEYDFLVNTGMSVVRKNALELIPEGRKFHMTDLVKSVITSGGRVGVFPISEKAWIDVGQWEEYHKSVKLLGIES